MNKFAVLPKLATTGSAGYDITATEEALIPCGGWKVVGSGIAIEMPRGIEAQLRPRSGLALKHGVTLLNSPATIDSDYRGEIKVILVNHGTKPFEVEIGMRIAQLVFTHVSAVVEFLQTSTLNDTQRGKGGFGSSGIK